MNTNSIVTDVPNRTTRKILFINIGNMIVIPKRNTVVKTALGPSKDPRIFHHIGEMFVPKD